jgi:hypothetical protein
MAGRPPVFTRTVTGIMVEHIRRGAVVQTAAEAAGISQATFHEWMARGERDEEPFAEFATAVRQARAQARVALEQWVWEHHPLSWLLFGPGRDRRGEPGWGKPAKPQVDATVEERVADAEDDEDSEWVEALAQAVREGAFGSGSLPPGEK